MRYILFSFFLILMSCDNQGIPKKTSLKLKNERLLWNLYYYHIEEMNDEYMKGYLLSSDTNDKLNISYFILGIKDHGGNPYYVVKKQESYYYGAYDQKKTNWLEGSKVLNLNFDGSTCMDQNMNPLKGYINTDNITIKEKNYHDLLIKNLVQDKELLFQPVSIDFFIVYTQMASVENVPCI